MGVDVQPAEGFEFHNTWRIGTFILNRQNCQTKWRPMAISSDSDASRLDLRQLN